MFALSYSMIQFLYIYGRFYNMLFDYGQKLCGMNKDFSTFWHTIIMFNMTQKFLKAKIIIQKKEFYAFCLFPPWNCFSVAFHEYAYMVHSSFLRFIFYLKKKFLNLTILKKFLSFPISLFLKLFMSQYCLLFHILHILGLCHQWWWRGRRSRGWYQGSGIPPLS